MHGQPHHPRPFGSLCRSTTKNLATGASSGSLKAALIIGRNGGHLGAKFIHTVLLHNQPQNCKCKFEIIHSVYAFEICLFIRFICCKRRWGWSWDCRDTTSHGAPTEGPHDLTRLLMYVTHLQVHELVSGVSKHQPAMSKGDAHFCWAQLSLLSSLVLRKLRLNVFCYSNLVYQLMAIWKHVQQIII